MTEPEIIEGLAEILRDVFDDDSLQVTQDTSAADIPDWDSLNQINIVVAAEMRFGVKFRTAELEGLRNVGELARLIRSKLRID
jgi:acyl carrier protein